MSLGRQQLYEKLCELSPFIRNGLFFLLASVSVMGSGYLLWSLIQFLFPVMDMGVSFILVGVMWLIWIVVCLIGVLYLSLLFQGK